MKTRSLVLTALALLAIPAVALAATNTLTGKVKGDSNSKITLKIKTNKQGTALKVTAVSLKNADYTCQNIPGKTGGQLTRSWRVSWSIESNGPGTPIEFDDRIPGRADDVYRFEGRLKNRKGRSVTGEINAIFDQVGEGQECQITNAKFTAKVK